MADSNENEQGRREGRAMACDGLLASEFGRRKTEAGAKAIQQLRKMQRRRTRNKAWLALAASAAILFGGLSYFLGAGHGSHFAVLEYPVPGGTIIRNNRFLEPVSGMEILPGDIVQTPKGAPARLRFHDSKTLLTISEHSDLQFLVSGPEFSILLKRGAIDMEYAPKSEGECLTVSTGQAEARVTGTHFILAAKQTSTWLQVLDGSVQFIRSDGGKEIVVASHQYSVAAAGLDLTVHPENERWQAPYSIKPSALALAL